MPARPPAAFPRRGLSFVAAILAATIVTAHALAQHPNVSLGPPPDWVTATTPGASRPHDPSTQIDGVEHLLLDEQLKHGFGPREYFWRHVYRLVDETGVRDGSRFEIEFDPSYETVTIHTFTLKRGAEVRSRLSETSFRLIERKPGFETVSIIAILDDARIGDEIEVACTRSGVNPMFEGRFATRFELAWSTPVRRLSHRVLVPKDKSIEIRTSRTQLAPAIRELGDVKELSLDLPDVPALVPESSIPLWFDPYPAVEYSEYSSWAEVARWGTRNFAPPSERSPELRDAIAALAARSSDPAELTVAALDFVRDEIRYQSNPMGPSSHRPASPATVLERRFGDSKDMALLLVTLLEGLDVDAWAALVNTQLCQSVASRLPSPLAFDHVIVRVVQGGGSYWLDPTALHARGTLDRRACPRFGSALVLDAETTDLTVIKPLSGDAWKYDCHREIDASDLGTDATMTVVTKSTFGAADTIRSKLAEEGSAALAKWNLDSYALTYPYIRSDTPIVVEDDERKNEVRVTERYVIPEFWKPADDGAWLEAVIAASEIYSFVSIPATGERTMPLDVSHPTVASLRIDARLGFDGSHFERIRRRVETDAVRFSCDIRPSNRTIIYDYEYETLRDSVPPEKVLAHGQKLDRVLDETSFVVRRPEPWRPSRSVLIFAVISFVVSGVIALALLRYRPAQRVVDADPSEAELVGIRGWLIVVAIIVVVSPILMAVGLLEFRPIVEHARWDALTSTGSSEYHGLWAPVVLGELFIGILRSVLSVVLAVLFFQKRRTFPTLYIADHTVWAVFALADALASNALPATHETNPWQVLFRTWFWISIWVVYLLLSRRVALTFVR